MQEGIDCVDAIPLRICNTIQSFQKNTRETTSRKNAEITLRAGMRILGITFF